MELEKITNESSKEKVQNSTVSLADALSRPSSPLENELVEEAIRLENLSKKTQQSCQSNSIQEKVQTPVIEAHHSKRSVSAKETQRRQGTKTCMADLKALVPGLTELSSDIETCQVATDYIAFLKTFVDEQEFDQEFLMSQII